MKKLYFSLCATFCVLSNHAQLTQSNHAPAGGDSYQMYRCDSVAAGSAGASQNWDFSAITTHSNIVLTYSSIAGTYTDYPAASVAVFSGTSDITYLNSDVNSLNFYGGNLSIGGGGTAVISKLKYGTPAIRGAYPMSLNTSSTAPIAGSLTISSPITTSGTFTGTSRVEVDGSGTLTLPGVGNTFTNVLRVVSSQTINFTTLIASGNVYQVTYDYFTPGVKFAQLSISTSTVTVPLLVNNTQTIVTRAKTAVVNPTTSILSQNFEANSSAFNVYPNPATSQLNFYSGFADVSIVSVFDVTGRLVAKLYLEEGNTKLDVSNWNQGLYLYIFSDKNQKTLKSGKLTVNH
jgi:hypothetical protein